MSDSIKQILAISLLSVLLMAGCASNTTNNTENETVKENNNTTTEQVNAGNNSSTSTNTASENGSEEVRVSYKDGTYEGEGSYISPGGKELVKVSMVVENGMIKSMDLNVDTQNPTSKRYKGLFKAGIDELVIGKPLEEIEGFSQVNGSSLTPKGFQQAVEAIKTEAKA